MFTVKSYGKPIFVVMFTIKSYGKPIFIVMFTVKSYSKHHTGREADNGVKPQKGDVPFLRMKASAGTKIVTGISKW